MTTREQQFDETILKVKQAISHNAYIEVESDTMTLTLDGNDFDHIAEQVAEELYDDGYRKAEEVRRETAKEIFIKLIQEIEELEQFYKAVAPKVAYTEINLVTTRAARKIVKRVLCKYGVTEEIEPNTVTLRLGIGKKDMDLMAKALREYAKNHPKYRANEANELAAMIERQRRKLEE